MMHYFFISGRTLRRSAARSLASASECASLSLSVISEPRSETVACATLPPSYFDTVARDSVSPVAADFDKPLPVGNAIWQGPVEDNTKLLRNQLSLEIEPAKWFVPGDGALGGFGHRFAGRIDDGDLDGGTPRSRRGALA